jgi:ribonuclease III
MEPLLPAALRVIVDAAPDRDAATRLVVEALTHRTFVNEQARGRDQGAGGKGDNQRLELLGDAVLELIVTRALYDALPAADEGLLSRARASVVNEAALADAARTIALGPALRLGRGEIASGGSERARTLADAFEAVVAAVYLGAGLDAASRFVDDALGPAIASAVSQAAPTAGPVDVDARVKDAKSILQEHVQLQGGAPPSYEIERADGPVHDRTFRVRVMVKGVAVGVGEGRSRREAEMRAAQQAVAALRDGTMPDGGAAPTT